MGLKIHNAGSLALKYIISMNIANETKGINKAGDEFALSDYLKVKTCTSAGDIGKAVVSMAFYKRNISLVWEESDFKAANIIANDVPSIPNNDNYPDQYYAIKVTMPDTVGNEANAISTDKAPSIEFGINVVATQHTTESDSFGSDYDKNATYPVMNAEGLKNALTDGGSHVLSDDVAIAPKIADKTAKTLAPQMTVSKDTVLDLADKKIGVDANDNFGEATPVLMAVTGGTLTINGEGVIDCEAGKQQVYGINVNGGKVVINGGKYYGALTAVQVQQGSLEINGGFFDMAPTCKAQVPQYAKYVVNCIDSHYKDGTATISIKGGTFVNFDPSNNPEGEGTSYVADGYKVVSEEQTNGDTWYTVVAK